MIKRQTNKKVPYKELGSILFSLAIIWLVGLWFIKDGISIRITNDEFGYWAAGAWMAGIDWSEVSTLNRYYSFGYGILLSFILRLPVNAVVRYQLAIILNIVMLSAVYLIIYYLLKKWKVCENSHIMSLISLAAILYTGNVYYTQYSMTETLILLLFWVFILLLHSINKKASAYKIILAAVLLGYVYMVHQRMLCLVVAGVVCLFYMQIRDKNYRMAFTFLAITAALLLGAEGIKKIFQEAYYINDNLKSNSYSLAINDYAGQVRKVEALFSVEGIRNFIISALGKIFYILSSTYLVAGIAMCKIMKDLYACIKEKKFSNDGTEKGFIFVTVILAIAIASIGLVDFSTRYDHLIYGRYNEFIVGALIVIGLITLFKTEKFDVKMHLLVGFFYLMCGFVVNMAIPGEDVPDATNASSTGIYDILNLSGKNIGAVVIKTLVMYVFILLIVRMLKNQRQKMIVYVCVILSCNWILSYYYTYNFGTLSWSTERTQKEVKLAEYIESLDINNNLYYYAPEGSRINYLQVLLDDISIQCVYDEQQIEELPQDAYLLTKTASELEDTETLEDFEPVEKSYLIQLWKRE